MLTLILSTLFSIFVGFLIGRWTTQPRRDVLEIQDDSQHGEVVRVFDGEGMLEAFPKDTASKLQNLLSLLNIESIMTEAKR